MCSVCATICQIFALDSAVVEVQVMFSSHGGHLTNAMYHHGKSEKISRITLKDIFATFKIRD